MRACSTASATFTAGTPFAAALVDEAARFVEEPLVTPPARIVERAFDLLDEVLVLVPDRGRDFAGLDERDPDRRAGSRELVALRLGERFEREFRRVVGREPRRREPAPDGADVHHAAVSGAQHRNGRPCECDDREEVHVEDPAPVGVGHVLHGAARADTGVVHERLQAAVARFARNLFDGAGDVVGLGHVEDDRAHVAREL